MKFYAEDAGVLVSKMEDSIEAHTQASLQTARIPVYPSGKSRDEVSGKSEQQHVDCGTVDSACNDEFMDNAFASCRENGPCTETSYSYIATRGSCKDSSCNVDNVQRSVTRYKDVSTVGERTLMSVVAWQPVSIASETDQSSFQSYSSGLLTASRGVRRATVE